MRNEQSVGTERIFLANPDPRLGQLHPIERTLPLKVVCGLPIQPRWQFVTEAERVASGRLVCSECRRIECLTNTPPP